MRKIFISVVAFFFATLLCSCSFFSGDYAKILETNWGVALPKESGYKETYVKQGGQGFQGDGLRYHVFGCEEMQPIIEAFSWGNERRKTNFYDSYKEACENWLNEIGVPQEERPNYEECSYWYDSQADLSELILLLSESQSKLYVVESFL